jgi:hypothetical protein
MNSSPKCERLQEEHFKYSVGQMKATQPPLRERKFRHLACTSTVDGRLATETVKSEIRHSGRLGDFAVREAQIS